MQPSRNRSAFTLIELLTVIAIIAVLMGLLLPALNSAKQAAKKVQARNDLSQFVTAVKAFYTDYGVYPVTSVAGGAATDQEFGYTQAGDAPNADLVNVLRADLNAADTLTSGSTPIGINTRQVSYLDVPYVKDTTAPKNGLGNGKETGATGGKAGSWYDPWGGTYIIAVDANYDGYTESQALTGYHDLTFVQSPTSAKSVQTGCIGASFGADKTPGTSNNYIYNGSDDVLSWQ